MGICWREGTVAVVCLPSSYYHSHSSSQGRDDSTIASTPPLEYPKSPPLSMSPPRGPATHPLYLFTVQCCCFSAGPFSPSQNSYACQTGQLVMNHRSICAIGFAMSGDIASSPSSFDGGLGGQGWICACFFDFLNPQ